MIPLPWLLGFLLLVNVVTWSLFGVDKWLARRHGGRETRPAPGTGKRGYQRVPENWLLGLAGVGGCAGAWVAIRTFRHKTKKAPFRWKLLLATVVAVGWLALGFYTGALGAPFGSEA